MSLLKHVQYKTLNDMAFNILNEHNEIYNHYTFYKKILLKMDIYASLHCCISNNFKILYLQFLKNNYKIFKNNNVIVFKDNVYYMGKNINAHNLEDYTPTEEDIQLFKFKKNTLYQKATHIKDLNVGDTIYHDLIKEKQYETIKNLVKNNDFDIQIKNYEGKTPKDIIQFNDSKMKMILNF